MDQIKYLQVRVDLDEVDPPIWRRILIPASTPLSQLHLFLQGAMGWDNCHLHGFRQGKQRFAEDLEDLESAEDETKVKVGELLPLVKAVLTYDYDFGDGWCHTLRLEKILMLAKDQLLGLPRLLDGERACPPEDCGGPWGYENLLHRLEAEDPEVLEWLELSYGDDAWSPGAFDREEHETHMRILGCGPRAGMPA